MDPKNDFRAKSFSTNHLFELNIPVGRYQIRGRVADARGVWGPWSTWSEFDVVPKKVSGLFFPQGLRRFRADKDAVTKSAKKTEIKITWPPSLGADFYSIRIFKAGSEETFFSSEQRNSLMVQPQLDPGQYNVEITAHSDKNLHSEILADQFTIEASQLAKPLLTDQHLPFGCKKWLNQSSGEISIVLSYKRFLDSQWQLLTPPSLEAEAFFQPGLYRLEITAKKEGYLDSEPLSQECLLKPKVL